MYIFTCVSDADGDVVRQAEYLHAVTFLPATIAQTLVSSKCYR